MGPSPTTGMGALGPGLRARPLLLRLCILLATAPLVLPSIPAAPGGAVPGRGRGMTDARAAPPRSHLLLLPVRGGLVLPLRGGGAPLRRKLSIRAAAAARGERGKKRGALGPEKGKMSIKEALLSRLHTVRERRAKMEEYQKTWTEGGGGGDEKNEKPGRRVKRVVKIDVNAKKAQRVEFDLSGAPGKEAREAHKPSKGGAGGAGSELVSATGETVEGGPDAAGNHRRERGGGWRAAAGVVAEQGGGEAAGAANATLAPSNASNLTFSATSPDGILAELARAGLCKQEDLDLRVRSFMVRLKKSGKTALLLKALQEFREHLARPISHSRRVRNKSAVLTKLLFAAERDAPRPFAPQCAPLGRQLPPKFAHSEEQVRWGQALQWGMSVEGAAQDLATASHNSTYMQSYPTVAGRRVFTNASSPVEVVLRVERMARMMFVGVVARGAANGSSNEWWGAPSMSGKAHYVVSNGRALDGGRLLAADTGGFAEGDTLVVRLEVAQGRVTLLREVGDANGEGSGGTEAYVLHVFQGAIDAVRVAVQMKEEGDSIRLVETRPYACSSAANVSDETDANGTSVNETKPPQDPRYTPPFEGKKIFVGGTRDLDSDDIETHFKQFGKVATVGVMRNKEGESRGFGFVTFFDVRDANRVLKKRVVVLKKGKEFARMQVLPCEAPTKGDLELDTRTAKVLREADEERAQARAQFKLERMTPAQLAAAELRSELTEHVGLDCEMVGGGIEGEEDLLAKVAVCNSKGEPLYVRYVVPRQEVVDYRTKITGIHPEHLFKKHGAVPFEEAQARVDKILKGRILVGHSVKHDLDVLLLSHPHLNIRDTAKYKPLRDIGKGGQPKLRDLALKILGKTIQVGAHDPFQDAWTAMQIYLKHQNFWEKSCMATSRFAASRLQQRGPDKRKLRAAKAKAVARQRQEAKLKKKKKG